MKGRAEKRAVLIVDDHTMVREGLAALVASDPALRVSGLCGTYDEAIRAAGADPPDVAVIDFSLPDRSGLELIGALGGLGRPVPSLLLTMHRERSIHESAIRAGAAGTLVKDDAADALIFEILRILKIPRGPSRAPVLSARETEVVGLLLDGYTSKEIAEKMRLSPRTIDTYRERLHSKFGSRNLAELALRSSRFRLREGGQLSS